jgi:hypothetical protein
MLKITSIFLLKIGILVISVMLVVGIFCLVSGRLTLEYFIKALEVAGFICVLIGCLSVVGAFVARGSFDIQYARSAGPENIDKRGKLDIKDILSSFRYLLLFILGGALLLLISSILYKEVG